MKKLRYFIVVVILLFLMILDLEYFCFYNFDYHIVEQGGFIKHLNNIVKYNNLNEEEKEHLLYDYRPVKHIADKSLNKNSIMLLGCSFTWGFGLKDDEIFSYLLEKQTNRPIYNFALNGASIKDNLYIFKNTKFFNKFVPKDTKFDYVIYTYIIDQNPRMYSDIYRCSPKYKINKKTYSLTEYKPLFNYYSLCIHKQLTRVYCRYFFKQTSNLFYTYLRILQKEIEKNLSYVDENGNIKTPQLVVLVYNEFYAYDDWDTLKKYDIKVVKLKDILDVDVNQPAYYIRKNNAHPNAEAWKLIVPALVKELNL